MEFELDRKDVISLLKGTEPNYDVMDKIPRDLGRYYGGFKDEWRWNSFISDKYSDEELLDFYLICKKSWE